MMIYLQVRVEKLIHKQKRIWIVFLSQIKVKRKLQNRIYLVVKVMKMIYSLANNRNRKRLKGKHYLMMIQTMMMIFLEVPKVYQNTGKMVSCFIPFNRCIYLGFVEFIKKDSVKVNIKTSNIRKLENVEAVEDPLSDLLK